MPSLYQAISTHTALFSRLNLVPREYEGLEEDLKGFISSSVLDKMESVRGNGGREGGGTLGELRRVRSGHHNCPRTYCVLCRLSTSPKYSQSTDDDIDVGARMFVVIV